MSKIIGTILSLFVLCALSEATNTQLKDTVASDMTVTTDTLSIIGDLFINDDVSLVVAKGTAVQVCGSFGIRVQGTLSMQGTKKKPIIVSAKDTTEGWRGIKFVNRGGVMDDNDTSRFSYCTFQYVSDTTNQFPSTGVILADQFHGIRFDYCLFTRNRSRHVFVGLIGGAYLKNCTIKGNYNTSGVYVTALREYRLSDERWVEASLSETMAQSREKLPFSDFTSVNESSIGFAETPLPEDDATILRSIFESGRVCGHETSRARDETRLYLQDCLISVPGRTAASTSLSGTIYLMNSTISDCTYGISVFDACVYATQCSFTKITQQCLSFTHWVGSGFDGCKFEQNNGILINNFSETFLRFTNCLFRKNTGAILKTSFQWTLLFDGCVFNANTNPDGPLFSIGYFNNVTNPEFINCLINGNTTENAPGLFTCRGRFDMLNSTIVNNSASGGSIIHCLEDPNDDTCCIRNTIFWGNQSPLLSGDSVDIAYSCIQEEYPGEGNLTVDPQLFFINYKTVYLTYTSPCINAGTQQVTGLTLPANDLYGNQRISGADVDMGAHEFVIKPPQVLSPIQDLSVSRRVKRIRNYAYLGSVFHDDVPMRFSVVSNTDPQLVMASLNKYGWVDLVFPSGLKGTAEIVVEAVNYFGLASRDTFVVTVEGR